MSFIHTIGTVIPDHHYSQEEMLNFLITHYSHLEIEKRKLGTFFRRSGINNRNSVLKDFKLKEKKSLFSESKTYTPNLYSRMKCFWYWAPFLGKMEAENCLKKIPKLKLSGITHLITISCTAVGLPGLDTTLIQSLALNKNITGTSINFLGCYEALYAIKSAISIVAENRSAVLLIVCVKICSIYFKYKIR